MQYLQKAVYRALGKSVPIKSAIRASGGSINQAYILELEDGSYLFIKTHSGSTVPGMYAAEARALELLAQPETLAIPRPIHGDDDFLVLEAFREGVPAANWDEKLGRGLALLHQATQQQRFGFDCDNFLGTSGQPNSWRDDWLAFWRDQRLGHQLALFRPNTTADDPLLAAGVKLVDRLADILDGTPEPAVLLHGDLWSGNAAADDAGEPVIYDPASYYGHREAEIGMMRLFGGFGPACEEAYQEVWPFQPGFDQRIEVYKLYHQLNHLNLFGRSYYDSCLVTINSLI